VKKFSLALGALFMVLSLNHARADGSPSAVSMVGGGATRTQMSDHRMSRKRPKAPPAARPAHPVKLSKGKGKTTRTWNNQAGMNGSTGFRTGDAPKSGWTRTQATTP